MRCDGIHNGTPAYFGIFGRRSREAARGSGRTRHAELLILCARIGFNP